MVGLGPSALSSWMQRVGVGWLAWELTHSPAWLGLIGAADLIPFLFLSPFAGVFIDSSSPHKILLASQWLQFVHASALAVSMYNGWLHIELLFTLTVFSGIVSSFATSARHAVVPNTVPKALVGTAVSLDSALFQASRFMGPAIAGFVIPLWGVFGAFAAHTLGSFVFCVVMQQMRMPAPERHKGPRHLISDIRESLDYIRSHPGIQPLFIMLATASICLRPMQDMLPGFAQSVFESDAVGLAWLTSAMGVGAMLGATRVALLGNFSGLSKMAFAGLFCSGLATFGMVATRQVWIGVGLVGDLWLCLQHPVCQRSGHRAIGGAGFHALAGDLFLYGHLSRYARFWRAVFREPCGIRGAALVLCACGGHLPAHSHRSMEAAGFDEWRL